MIRFSFFTTNSDYPNTREEARKLLETTDKKILYTFGLKYRHPTVCEVEISNTKALNYFDNSSMSDVEEYEDYIDFNQYSSNDMW